MCGGEKLSARYVTIDAHLYAECIRCSVTPFITGSAVPDVDRRERRMKRTSHESCSFERRRETKIDERKQQYC